MLRHIGQRASGILSRSCVQEEHLHDSIMLHWLVLVYMTATCTMSLAQLAASTTGFS